MQSNQGKRQEFHRKMSNVQKTDVTYELVDELQMKTKEFLQPNPTARAKMAAVKGISKLSGQAKASTYPQPEGVLGDCMLMYGKKLGEDSIFGTYHLNSIQSRRQKKLDPQLFHNIKCFRIRAVSPKNVLTSTMLLLYSLVKPQIITIYFVSKYTIYNFLFYKKNFFSFDNFSFEIVHKYYLITILNDENFTLFSHWNSLMFDAK